MNLNKIQQTLKAPKGQKNAFGNYMYRSCEDILEAVKPLLGDATITLSDEIWMVGDRFYIKATATYTEGKESVSVTAYARESFDKKGMDSAQITGAASSYARKYALNGLLLIDDTKDADTKDNTEEKVDAKKYAPKKAETPFEAAKRMIEECTTQADLEALMHKIEAGKKLDEEDKQNLTEMADARIQIILG